MSHFFASTINYTNDVEIIGVYSTKEKAIEVSETKLEIPGAVRAFVVKLEVDKEMEEEDIVWFKDVDKEAVILSPVKINYTQQLPKYTKEV